MSNLQDKRRIGAIKAALGRRNIVVVGMMGCGKSAVGRLLGDELDLPYFDSDTEIIQAAGLSIAEIFSRFGEDYFRSGERRVVARLLAEGPSVLSLGGGAFLSAETRELIKLYGVSIWLMADVELLYSRIMRRPRSRPLLDTADPKATLGALLEMRAPTYALADIHVASSSVSKNQTGEAVLKALETWLAQNQTETGAVT